MAARGVGRLSVGRAAESSRFTPRAVKHTRGETGASPAEDSAVVFYPPSSRPTLRVACKLLISMEIALAALPPEQPPYPPTSRPTHRMVMQPPYLPQVLLPP